MRVADTAPAYCSGCFQAKPSDCHVDFDVAWDGPTITDGVAGGDEGIVQTIAVAIDDLILCEDCLKKAAALVGMVDPGAESAELEQLRDSNQHLVEKVRGLEDYTTKLGAALGARPASARKRQPTAVN